MATGPTTSARFGGGAGTTIEQISQATTTRPTALRLTPLSRYEEQQARLTVVSTEQTLTSAVTEIPTPTAIVLSVGVSEGSGSTVHEKEDVILVVNVFALAKGESSATGLSFTPQRVC